jgi:hypothetical protein
MVANFASRPSSARGSPVKLEELHGTVSLLGDGVILLLRRGAGLAGNFGRLRNFLFGKT